MKPTCPYCQVPATLVGGEAIYPRRPDLFDLKFWQCLPCDAYVGCHKPDVGYGDGTRPLGRLANVELRAAKIRAHAAFDPLWKYNSKCMSRSAAYAWLASALGIPPAQTHIGEFDVQTCLKVERLARIKRLEVSRAKTPV